MRWLLGFLLGALGGFALGCLAAPTAGAELRTVARRRLTRDEGHGGEESEQYEIAARTRARPPLGMLPDEQVTRDVRERLAAEGLTNPRVDVTTVDEVVYLRGRPGNAGEANAIVRIVENTPGVQRVVDELKRPDGLNGA